MIEPMYLVGSSMGGSIVSMFATKYPSYVLMVCLLAPVPRKYLELYSMKFAFCIHIIAGENFETDLVRQLRSGVYHIVLPETLKQFYAAADMLSMKKIRFHRLLAKE